VGPSRQRAAGPSRLRVGGADHAPDRFRRAALADAAELNASFGALPSESTARDGRIGTLATGPAVLAARGRR